MQKMDTEMLESKIQIAKFTFWDFYIVFFQVRELTNVARANAATGTATANLVAEQGGASITAAIATNINNIINGNRDFINAIAAIDNLDC